MAELIEQLSGQCGIPVRMHGALRLIRREDCEKIVEECKTRNLLILGIEAFKLERDGVMSDTDLIADYSKLVTKDWEAACLEASRSAEAYFKELQNRTDLWFDFSLRAPQ